MRRLITLVTLLFISLGFSQSNEIDSLALQLAFQNQDSLKVDVSLKLIKSLYDSNDYERAIKYIIESEKLSNSINHKKGIAEITYYKALIYAEKNDYINAISGYEKSKRLFNKLNDTISIAKVNNSIGLIEIKRGNFNKGLQYSLNAIRELEKRHLKTDLNLAYNNLAQAYSSINQKDKAIEYYLKTLEVQEQLNDESAIFKTNTILAGLYSERKEHRKAIEIYETLIENTNPKNDSILGHLYPKLGGEYLEFNDFEKASNYLNEGYDINVLKTNKTDLLITLNNLANLNISQNKLTLAEEQLLKAGEIAKNSNNKPELLKQYKLLKALDSLRQRFEKAYAWQRAYYELKEEIQQEKAALNTKINESFDVLEFDTVNIASTNQHTTTPINTSSTLQNAKLKQLNMGLYFTVGLLIVISTFFVVFLLKRNNTIKYTKKLEEKNIKIELQNEAFSKQTKHLENVNNVKDKLFSIVSHDLKDSLSSINGFIDLLKDGSLSREEFDTLIPELSENANNASLLLFNLLNWSKSQMQSLEPKPSLFDIQEVFESKVSLIEQRMQNKGITLIDRSLRDFAYADRSMFEIIIQNLLANALKFCKKDDSITISNHISNGCCIISVADSGIGISKQNLDKLFKEDSFSTLGTDNEKGTGLGLSICKELVELNHGKIWVESTQGIGSTFYVQLPKSNPDIS
ncbi:ATP-binding protein [Tamlana sp. I1]|uniref:ATP-binding protein n=1 Tax=Tamlana sp. I1 TaxID=2762061 RepID=UPI001890AE5E|nr:ATP-binding protein [Tamlana sp. I1]